MKSFITYDLTSGEIISSGSCSDDQYKYQRVSGQGLIEGVASIWTGFVRDGVLISYTTAQAATKVNKPYYPCIWSNETFNWIDTRTDQQKYNDAAGSVVVNRDQLLSDSDWVVVRAVDKGEPIPVDWQTYRQQLRDITNQPGYPFNIIWPTQPT